MGTQLFSASFNCTQAQTSIEKQICKSERLDLLDRKVSGYYQSIQMEPKNFYLKNTLRNTQRKWIKLRNKTCASTVTQENCLIKMYENRLQALIDLDELTNNSISIVEKGRCSTINIIKQSTIDIEPKMCNSYRYFDKEKFILLTKTVLNQETKNITYKLIFKGANSSNSVSANECEEVREQGIYEQNIVYINQNVLSFQYFGWEYTGGAHGNGGNYYINFNRNDGSVIRWSTLFKENKKFKAYLKNRVKNELLVEGYLNKKYEDDTLEAFTTNGYFSIRNDGLYIEYPSYELAPYSSGYPSLLVSKKTLKKYMKNSLYRKYFINDGSVYLQASCE